MKLYIYDLASPVVIIEAPTGVTYCNQVNGVATEEACAEGYLIPLPQSSARVFTPSWWEKHRNTTSHNASLPENIIEEIEHETRSLFERAYYSAPARVTVKREVRNVEAWVHVEIEWMEEAEEGMEGDGVAVTLQGVLTWENCD